MEMVFLVIQEIMLFHALYICISFLKTNALLGVFEVFIKKYISVE